MEDLFNAIIKEDARILEDVQHMKDDQRQELEKFNKLMDSFYLSMEAKQQF